MEERELRITYGMCFKGALEIIGRADISQLTVGDIASETAALTDALVDAAVAGQERIASAYSHLVTKTSSSGGKGNWQNKGSSSRSSSPRSGGTPAPKNPGAPASPKQVALATRLYWDKEHNLDVDPDSFGSMTMGEIGPIIEKLIAA